MYACGQWLKQWLIQEFPDGRGRQPIMWTISRKMHENEDIWAESEGAASPAPPIFANVREKCHRRESRCSMVSQLSLEASVIRTYIIPCLFYLQVSTVGWDFTWRRGDGNIDYQGYLSYDPVGGRKRRVSIKRERAPASGNKSRLVTSLVMSRCLCRESSECDTVQIPKPTCDLFLFLQKVKRTFKIKTFEKMHCILMNNIVVSTCFWFRTVYLVVESVPVLDYVPCVWLWSEPVAQCRMVDNQHGNLVSLR